MITREETITQSQRTFDKWKPYWMANAKRNRELLNMDYKIETVKQNKELYIFSFGPGFAENLAALKSQNIHHSADIMVVDKGFGSMLKAGVIPKYVVTADARVNIDEVIDRTKIHPSIIKGITLFSCVISNPSWAEYWVNCDGKYMFYLNKDGINSQLVFKEFFKYDLIAGKSESLIIPAATNVANTAYVLAATVLHYKNIYLCGFDYSFKMNGNYYGDVSYNDIHRDHKIKKHKTDCHMTMIDINNQLTQASSSMQFSCRWLVDFINKCGQQLGVNTINLTGSGILSIPYQAKIELKAA